MLRFLAVWLKVQAVAVTVALLVAPQFVSVPTWYRWYALGMTLGEVAVILLTRDIETFFSRGW